MKTLVEWTFLILVFSVGFMLPYFDLLNNRIPLTDFIFLGVSALWFLAFVFRKIKLRWSWFYLPLAIFFFSLVLSAIFSVNQKHSLLKLLGVIYLLGLAFLAFNIVQDAKMIKRSVLTWLIATAVTCLVSIIALMVFYVDRENWLLPYTLSHYGTLPPGNYPRIQSTFLNPNMYCNYLNISAVFAVLAYKFGWVKPWLLYLFAVVFSIAAFFTISPGLGGIALCLGLWLWLEFAEKGKSLLSKLSLATGILGAILFFVSMLPSPVKFSEPSSRVLVWQDAIKTLFQYPVFGKGLGEDVAAVTYVDASGGTQFLGDAHELWLNVAGEAGFVGLLAILFLTFYFFRQALPLKFTDEKSYLRIGFGLAFIGAFMYQGLSGSFEDARQIWLLIGLFGAVVETDFSNQSESAKLSS